MQEKFSQKTVANQLVKILWKCIKDLKQTDFKVSKFSNSITKIIRFILNTLKHKS